MAPFYTDFIYI